MKNKKKVKQKELKTEKKAKSEYDANSFYLKHPTWRFSKRDRQHEKRCIKDGEFDKILVEKLDSFETMTWKEIMEATCGRDHNTRNHFIGCDKLTKEAQSRLKELKLYEKADGSFFSLSLNNRIRLWGILVGGIFEIIWLDNEHEVYKYNKKHT